MKKQNDAKIGNRSHVVVEEDDLKKSLKAFNNIDPHSNAQNAETLSAHSNLQDKMPQRNEKVAKNFSKRIRSFSIDLLRSIELAHDMVDLRNSNFVNATQTAAAQQYSSHNEQLDLEYGADSSACDENHKMINSKKVKIANRPINRSFQEIETSKPVESFHRTSKSSVSLNDLEMNLNKVKNKKSYTVKSTRKHVSNPTKKSIPDDIHISILEVFIYMWGVVTFFADFITDIILSIEYFNNAKFWLGFMTLIFVIVPNVTLSLFSLSWYIDKYYSTTNKNKLAKTNTTGDLLIYSKSICFKTNSQLFQQPIRTIQPNITIRIHAIRSHFG